IVHRFGGRGSALRSFADHVLLQASAFQEFFSRLRLERIRSDRGEDDPAALYAITVELNCDGRARDRKINRAPAAQLHVCAPCVGRSAQAQTGYTLVGLLGYVP